MNNHLKSELWEIQALLYWLLATQLHNLWLQVPLVVWGIITLAGSIIIKAKQMERDKYEKRS